MSQNDPGRTDVAIAGPTLFVSVQMGAFCCCLSAEVSECVPHLALPSEVLRSFFSPGWCLSSKYLNRGELCIFSSLMYLAREMLWMSVLQCTWHIFLLNLSVGFIAYFLSFSLAIEKPVLLSVSHLLNAVATVHVWFLFDMIDWIWPCVYKLSSEMTAVPALAVQHCVCVCVCA